MTLAERRKRLEAEKKGGKNSQVSPRDRRRSGQSSQAFPKTLRKRSTKATEKPPISHGKTAQAEFEEAAAKTKEARTEPKHQGTGKATQHGKPSANRGNQGAKAREPKSHPRETNRQGEGEETKLMSY
ncbi:hypothetical protein MA16_Dca013698 [Dendrobium catenatum]|uniref:Uncharacterized protein n=1 Tax=Dendrobium catenatum TaxID=906689 RepID=A0A2I0WPJ1_9ASPA|nr:hypothetical protein MA16_Dca013698 [Dendrobium catenatum]